MSEPTQNQFIYEYETVGENLAEHIMCTPALQSYFQSDFGNVRARQYCGMLHFEGVNYYILPKIAKDEPSNLRTFIYMLMYANDVVLSNEQVASCANERASIIEVFVQLFARGLLGELRGGVYKKYTTKSENLPVLRGKYLVNENLKYNLTKNKIYCEYDEFSEDNKLNRFFLHAVRTLQKYVQDKKLLKQCELALDEVVRTPIDPNRLNIHFDRLNKRFAPSYETALLLLRQPIPTFDDGRRSFAFLFDMNVLFEKFVGKFSLYSQDRMPSPV